jgi:hypothetical protein
MGFGDDIEVRVSPAWRWGRTVRWLLLLLVVIVIVGAVVAQSLWFWLNLAEFGELFLRPIYFELLGGFILSILILFRVDFKNRRSVTWWSINFAVNFVRARGMVEALPPEYVDFARYRLSPVNFLLWQVTKVLIGAAIFRNVIFGLTVYAMLSGWDAGLMGLWNLFLLPFITPPLDMNYAREMVIPLIPTLTLLVTPLLSALGFRLILLVGLTELVKILTPRVEDLRARTPPKAWRWVATIEALIALALLWVAVNGFFPSYIDYNTKYAIGGLILIGGIFAFFAYRDRGVRSYYLTARRFAMRIMAILIIALIIGSVMAVNNSIADVNKRAWLFPYTVQEIAVNRYLAEIDQIREIPYKFGQNTISPQEIRPYLEANRDLLNKIRLWDWEAAFAKLKPEIGLKPYIDFEDSDILRFNGSLYWSASMSLVLPETVRPEDRWYAEHMVYTHVPEGFLLLDGHSGEIVDPERFFKQRRIYYGEGGLFDEVWVAFLADRTKSDEVEGFFYNGTGGITIDPPLTWVFEPNFFFSYIDKSIHIIRYRDVYARMSLLFPYFLYQWQGDWIDMFPVSDGERTYWLMPLIVRLDGSNIPWSNRNPMLRFVGYALIDIYEGDIQLLVLGDDFFSRLFKTAYADYITTEVPEWLVNQTRYPAEIFEWRVAMYNFYHVTDPAIFVNAQQFFEVPRGLDTYYIMAKPWKFNKTEFVGILSLELRGARGRNLAGYMVVRNDYPHLGEMIFYQVPLGSEIKLLGPSAVLEALERDPDFATLRTLLRSPRVGDNILYRVGDFDVYFIPVYTAGAGGVVTQLGTIAAVGAVFTGEYYVGLGQTVEEAFTNLLTKFAGEAPPPPEPAIGVQERVAVLAERFREAGLKVVEPTSVNPDLAFLEGNATFTRKAERDEAMELVDRFISEWVEPYGAGRVLMWWEDNTILFGVMVRVEGVVELHYIAIYMGE